jgi:hypothetical protein
VPCGKSFFPLRRPFGFQQEECHTSFWKATGKDGDYAFDKVASNISGDYKFVIKPRNGLVGKFKGHSVDGWWIQDEA